MVKVSKQFDRNIIGLLLSDHSTKLMNYQYQNKYWSKKLASYKDIELQNYPHITSSSDPVLSQRMAHNSHCLWLRYLCSLKKYLFLIKKCIRFMEQNEDIHDYKCCQCYEN